MTSIVGIPVNAIIIEDHPTGFATCMTFRHRHFRLIPIRMLNTNIEMRETHHGTQPFFVLSQFIETLAEDFNQQIK
jgi:hypothetical protein